MSTEFDNQGFSAVSSFFGGQGVEEETALNLKPKEKKRNRLGVGAKSKIEEETLERLESEETKKRILSVGKKRKHEEDSDNSGDDDVIESEEEDEGRTSIKASKKPVSVVDEIKADIPVKKAKKKKKSKKERIAEKAEKESQDAIAKPEEENQIPPSKTEEPVQDLAMEISREPDIVEGRGTAVERKKKRRKVRSKQKNIKKDNRATNEKPDHLRVGSKTYAGRPMTRETRQFKNLPESRTSQIRRDRESKKFERPKDNDNPFEGGLGIDEFTSDTMNVAEEGPDSGEVVNADGTVVETSTTDKKSKKKNKKKKSKYKNLK